MGDLTVALLAGHSALAIETMVKRGGDRHALEPDPETRPEAESPEDAPIEDQPAEAEGAAEAAQAAGDPALLKTGVYDSLNPKPTPAP